MGSRRPRPLVGDRVGPPSRLHGVPTSLPEQAEKDRQERILDAVLRLIARGGISAVSMRAVSAEAGVSLGLVNYDYDDKTSLIGAALGRRHRGHARRLSKRWRWWSRVLTLSDGCVLSVSA